MLRAPGLILLLGLAVCAAPARGQVASKVAAVRLVASVQESFALVPVAQPTEVGEATDPTSGPGDLQVAISWRLRQGRTFQVGYELADEGVDHPGILSNGTIVPSQFIDTIPIFSFLPETPKEVKPIGVWGNRETDPSGLAGLLIGLPKSGPSPHTVLRLRAVIL